MTNLFGVIGPVYTVLKAIAMTVAVATLAAGEPFWHQLLLVVISASFTAIGMIVAALITANRVEKKLDTQHDTLTDIARSRGITNRETDDK